MPLVDNNTLDLVFKGFQTVYTDAYMSAEVHWDKIAMKVTSTGRDETYGWLGQFPQLREWLGKRHVNGLEAHSFTIQNIDFETTVSVDRNDISDDRLGVFKPAFSEMGYLARQHPEELVMGLLSKGFSTTCYDGQNFFDTDHPVTPHQGSEVGTQTVSNMLAGGGPGWFLLDLSRPIKPLIFQERKPYDFVSMDSPTDTNVFMNREFLYGVDARVNAGLGLWQLAFGSQATLSAANYAAARAAMMDFRADGGRKLGIKPTTLVVPPALEKSALEIVNAVRNESGASNVWAGTADLIVSPFLTDGS